MPYKSSHFALLASAVFLTLCLTAETLGNAAAPGFWQTGTGSTFAPLFAEDSLFYSQIQMQSEVVTIRLYEGFAVVKGEYRMKNFSTHALSMRVGYPTNKSYFASAPGLIEYGDLFHLRVLVNGVETRVEKLSRDSISHYTSNPNLTDSERARFSEDWHLWRTTFEPQAMTTLTVYFTVNTNEARLRRGYSSDDDCGFVYIVDSGKAWAEKIERGRIYIELTPPLTDSDVLGIMPDSTLRSGAVSGKTIYLYDFTGLEPEPEHNLVVRYRKTHPSLNFEDAAKNFTDYYTALDSIDAAGVSSENFTPLSRADFSVGGWGDFFIGALFMLMLIGAVLGPYLIGGVIIFGIAVVVIRYLRR